MRINLRRHTLTALEEKVLRMRLGLPADPRTRLGALASDPKVAHELARLERQLLRVTPLRPRRA